MYDLAIPVAAALAAFLAGRATASRSDADRRAYLNTKAATMVGAAQDVLAAARELRAERAAAVEARRKATAKGRRAPWDDLAAADGEALAEYFSALPDCDRLVFLTLAPAQQAANALTALPTADGARLLSTLVAYKGAPVAEVERIEEALRERFLAPQRRMWRPDDAARQAADLMQQIDRTKENELLGELETLDLAAAENIKKQMFTFEDVVRIDSYGIQTMLRHLEKDRLCLALKGASDAVKELFFANMSDRAGKMLREDMDAMGPVRLRDVDQSQSLIVVVAKELAASGQIVIGDIGEEDELVY